MDCALVGQEPCGVQQLNAWAWLRPDLAEVALVPLQMCVQMWRREGVDGVRARQVLTARSRWADFAADRDRSLRLLLDLVRRAKEAGSLQADFVLEDVSLALMANEGIRAESPGMRVAASRRFAALMIQPFQADPVPAPLPPAVRLPLSRC
ncbi:hypothetical protein [Streptomyces hygroscopicus]|uniref:hypothetical protein n=1 Tax=Streptomyces hygroscopicus TaxID=1912 RepID=UPI0018FEA171|nr:hypothetical protein [Streptomyces hygroscopicus]